MTRITAAAFPELRRVFGGYLHEDYLVESGTPEAALRAFREDAAPADLSPRNSRESGVNSMKLSAISFQLSARLKL